MTRVDGHPPCTRPSRGPASRPVTTSKSKNIDPGSLSHPQHHLLTLALTHFRDQGGHGAHDARSGRQHVGDGEAEEQMEADVAAGRERVAFMVQDPYGHAQGADETEEGRTWVVCMCVSMRVCICVCVCVYIVVCVCVCI